MRFWFHYNKPASRKAGKPRFTCHINGKCYLVSAITCRVSTWTRTRKRQPYAVVAGEARQFYFLEKDHLFLA